MVPKQVWILNHYAQQPGGIGGTRHYSLARHLRACGWNSTIIASSIEHRGGDQRLPANVDQQLQHFCGVPFLWLRTSGYDGNGVGRIWNMVQYTVAVSRKDKMLEIAPPPDVIIGSSVHPLAAWAGLRLSQQFQVPFIFEVRDLWPQTLIDMGRLSKWHPIAVALRVLERHLYRNANAIITLLPKAAEYIQTAGVDPSRVVWIPNGADLEIYPNVAEPRSTDSAFTLMFFGTHGESFALRNLLYAMRQVEETPEGHHIRLRLIGSGPAKASLIELANELGLTRVHFENPVPKYEIPGLAAEADAFVICVRDLPNLYRFGISMNKIFDYMAAGRPVIISADVPGNPIAEAGSGIVVPPDKPTDLATAILAMASLSPEERHRLSHAGRRHVEKNYSMAILAEKLGAVLDACATESGEA